MHFFIVVDRDTLQYIDNRQMLSCFVEKRELMETIFYRGNQV